MTEAKDKAKKNNYQKAFDAFSQAMKAFHKGDLEKSIELLKAFPQKFPGETEFVDRARIYLAICENRKSPQKDTLKSFDDYYQNGVYHINMGHFDEALNVLEKAAAKEPKEGKIPYMMALAAIKKEETDQALDYLKKAVKIDGFFGILARNEVDFESIAEDEKFIEIIGKE